MAWPHNHLVHHALALDDVIVIFRFLPSWPYDKNDAHFDASSIKFNIAKDIICRWNTVSYWGEQQELWCMVGFGEIGFSLVWLLEFHHNKTVSFSVCWNYFCQASICQNVSIRLLWYHTLNKLTTITHESDKIQLQFCKLCLCNLSRYCPACSVE